MSLWDLTADSEEDEEEQEREFARMIPAAATGVAQTPMHVQPTHDADASEEEDDVEDEEEEMAGLVVADAFVPSAQGGPSTPAPAADEPLTRVRQDDDMQDEMEEEEMAGLVVAHAFVPSGESSGPSTPAPTDGDVPLKRVRLKFRENPFYSCPRHPDCMRKPPPLLLDAKGEKLKMNEAVLVQWNAELKSLARVQGLGSEPNTLLVDVAVGTEAKPAQMIRMPTITVSRIQHPPSTLRELLEASSLRLIVDAAGLNEDDNEHHIQVAKQLYLCLKDRCDPRHNEELDQIISIRETELRPKRGSVTRVVSYSEKNRRGPRGGGGGASGKTTGPGRACFGAPTPTLGDEHGSAFSPVQVPPSLLRLSRTDSYADDNNNVSSGGREIRAAVGRADSPPGKAPLRRFGDSVVGGGAGGRVIFGGNIPVRASEDLVAQHAAKRQKILMRDEAATKEEEEEEEEEEVLEGEEDLRTPAVYTTSLLASTMTMDASEATERPVRSRAILMEMEGGRVGAPPVAKAAVVAAAEVPEAEAVEEVEAEVAQSQSEREFWRLAARMAALPDVPLPAKRAFAQQLTRAGDQQHHGATR